MLTRNWLKLTYSVEAIREFHVHNLEVVEKFNEHTELRRNGGLILITQEEIDVGGYYGVHVPKVASLEAYRSIGKLLTHRITRDLTVVADRVSMENLDDQSASVPTVHNLLAELVNLETNYRILHWNAEGLGYYSIHKLTEEHQNAISDEIDRLAEAIRACGTRTIYGLNEVIRMRTSTDLVSTEEKPTTNDMVARLQSYNEIFAGLAQGYIDLTEGEHRHILPLLEELVLSAKHRAMQMKSSLT